MKDFFISYSKADRDWAISIDRWLKEAGYSTHFQEADFPPGSNWAYEMVQGGEAARTIAVLSPDYLTGNWIWPEMLTAFAADPKGEKRKLLFVRVRDCQLPQMLRQIVDINLIGKTGDEARKLLLDGVEASRQELNLPQPYPVDALIERYCQRLQSKISTVRIFGDEQPHPLDQVFVESTINEDYERRPHQAEFLGLMDAELRKMRSVFGDSEDRNLDREATDDPTRRKTKRTIKPNELLRRHTHAIVTGAPGCGKTTLLRYLAWQTLKEFVVPPSGGSFLDQAIPPEGGITNSARMPVFLELKQLSVADFAQGSLEDLLFHKAIAAAVKPRNDAERDALKQHFRTLLEQGRVAIFLDGMDEVSGASFFRDLQTAVTDFLHSAYGNNTVIISTRPFALRQLGNAKAMEIQPLSPRQIEQFIEHYYRDVPERQQFQRELQRRRELRELARVPALLGFILQLWRKQGTVTDDKLELYAQITQELVTQLDREKEGIAPEREWLVPDKDGSLKLDLLRQLAFNQLFRGLIHPPYDIGSTDNDATRLVFTSEQLRAEAAAFARTLKEREGLTINPRNLAEDVKATALLRQVGADHYAFAHLTLQEYLAAWQLAKGDNADTCERIFCRAYFNPTLAEMDALPMTLGLVDEPGKLYEALEQLPESLSLAGLRLRARGLSHAKASRQMLERLVSRLDDFIKLDIREERGYFDAVLSAYANARGDNLNAILNHIAFSFGSDKDEYERERAVEALALFRHENAVTLLRGALTDKNDDVRIRAAAAISWSDLDCTVNALKKDLKHPDQDVRKKVVYTAWQLVGEVAREVLIEALNDESAAVIEDAIEALGDVGGEGVVSLIIEFLRSDLERASEKAADALGSIGGDGALNGLLDRLEKPNCKAKQQIIRALGEIGDARAVPCLLKIIEDGTSSDRIEAVKALGRVRSELQVKPLRKLLEEVNQKWLDEYDNRYSFFSEDHESILIVIAESLRQLGESCGREVLLSIVEKGDDYNKKNAVQSLAMMGGDIAENALLMAWEKAKSDYAIAKQNKLSQNQNNPLQNQSGQNSLVINVEMYFRPDFLASLAYLLTKLGHHQIVSTIVEWLDDKSFDSGSALSGDPKLALISNALGRCKGKQAVEGLVKIFHSGKWDSEFMALTGLGNIQDEYAIMGLLLGFSVYQRYFQMRAVYRMVSMEDETILCGLTLALSNSNNFVRRKAAELIAYYSKDQSSIERLQLIATTDVSEKAKHAASLSLQKLERKLQYLDIPIRVTSDHLQPS